MEFQETNKNDQSALELFDPTLAQEEIVGGEAPTEEELNEFEAANGVFLGVYEHDRIY